MMQMPKITECQVKQCAYNNNSQCHALAVTVGGGLDHVCDTFFEYSGQGGDPNTTGSVGACRCTNCSNNQSLECQASEISVGWKGTDPNCLAFRPK